jgi:hypothetical protein
MAIIKAPWNDDQVQSLNGFQGVSLFHPFTCGARDADNSHHVLLATPDGWVCPKCPEYHQDWCHDFMADWSWKRSVTPEAERLHRYFQDMADNA